MTSKSATKKDTTLDSSLDMVRCGLLMRCCGGKKEEPPPMGERRRCTDLMCCLLLTFCSVAAAAIFVWAALTGDPAALVYDADYLGNRCQRHILSHHRTIPMHHQCRRVTRANYFAVPPSSHPILPY